jgi:hypothetical protein
MDDVTLRRWCRNTQKSMSVNTSMSASQPDAMNLEKNEGDLQVEAAYQARTAQ